ncbi:hypothetical protein JTE90_015315 [Oedothorax gibbosus]|uniref:Uncharacterized protein n=1 Tax=Oedothorax gibbosus TaxID=931172 RepID=A0AAV6VR53_9ARAC|nr:hypothetical protein JTE90_015315 [Oedothorax gibbosus]
MVGSEICVKNPLTKYNSQGLFERTPKDVPAKPLKCTSKRSIELSPDNLISRAALNRNLWKARGCSEHQFSSYDADHH